MIPTDVHSFSRPFAQEHGVSAAIIAKHLAYKMQGSKNIKDGKPWHYNSAKKLSPNFPYLSRASIAENIKKLEADEKLEIGNYNRRQNDRTQWFHVTGEVRAEVEKDLLRFDAHVAKEHGVLASVLHYNLCYFLGRQSKKHGTPEHTMSPVELANALPFSESAIKKTLGAMVKSGLIVKCPDQRGKYTLPTADIALLRRQR